MIGVAMAVPTESLLRRLVLALLAAGLAGLLAELVAMGHYEDWQQLIPIVTVALSLAAILWLAAAGSATSLRVLRLLMVALILAGAAGMFFHFQGNREFQLEIHPDLAGWELVAKILHAKSPPALAPGVMAQLGMFGLVFVFRHPLLGQRNVPGSSPSSSTTLEA